MEAADGETETEMPAPPLAEEPVPAPGAWDDPFVEGGPEDEQEEDGEEDEDEEPEAAAGVGAPTTPAPAPAADAAEARPQRSRGRARGTRNKPKLLQSAELTARQQAAAEAEAKARAAAAPAEEPIARATYNTQGFDPRDVMIVWPAILENLRKNGRGPQDLFLRIERTAVGMYASPANIIDANLPADDFGGDETRSGAAQIVDYVTQVHHLGRTKVSGPAIYKIYAHHKVGTGGYRPMQMRLDHPDEILAAQRRKAEYDAQQRMSRPVAPIGLPRPGVGAAPPVAYPGQAAPQSQPAAPTGFGVQDFEQWRRYEEFRASLIASGQPAPPPPVMMAPAPAPAQPAAPPAPRLSPEEQEMLEEAKFLRRARTLGWVPKEQAAAVPAPAAAVNAAANNPVEALRGFAKTIKDIDSLKVEIGELFGVKAAAEAAEPEPDPEDDADKPEIVKLPIATAFGKPIFYPKNTDGTVDFIQKAILANPEMSNELAMKFVAAAMKQLDGSNFLRLLEKLAAGGGVGPQVAEAARAAGMVGTGAPTNGLVRPKGPMA